MSARVLKSGVLKVVEFEFRPINSDGDVIDPQFCETLAEAMAYTGSAVGSYGGECVGWVVEEHASYRPAHLAPGEPDVYKTRATGGNGDALVAGGWAAEVLA